MELAIGQIGLPEFDYNRLKKIMASAVVKRAFKHRWVIGKPENADFLIVVAGSVESAELAAVTRSDSNPVIVVMAGESDSVPEGCKRISWPFRYDELIPMLNNLENQRAVNDESQAEVPQTDKRQLESESSNPIIRLALMIKDSSGDSGSNKRAWQVDGIAESPIFVIPGEPYFYFKGSLAGLQNLAADAELNFSTVPAEEIEIKSARKPLLMLQWLVGINSGSFGLLPWLQDQRAYKLRRYPAFEMLHHTPEHRRIAATLTRPCQNMQQIAQLTHADDKTIAGFVNASNICGYLLAADSKTMGTTTAKKSGAPRRALIQSFRKALGITSTHV
jgi:hypothetical protein